MSSRLIWSFTVLARRIWFRATLFSIAAVATALLAIVATPYIPADLSTKIGANSVDKILGIIASSMLTVTTFSLSTMVSAFSAATTNVTPRATRLVMEDSTTQNVLATFVGSFLFSLVGIIALTTGAYGEQGRLILFVVTIAVIALIVVTLLRWIDHLSRLGRVTETTRRVEETTLRAVKAWQKAPNLGGHSLQRDRNPAREITAFFSDRVGYVQHVDSGALGKIADDHGVDVFVTAIPGKLVTPEVPLGWTAGAIDEDACKRVADCFAVEDVRSFDQDPRFGAAVLAEIASRALSTAVNDPGTAIDVISRAIRILHNWKHEADARIGDEVMYPRLHVASVEVADLFDDLFTPIARDGAAIVEVGLRLQKALDLLAALGPEFRQNAARHSKSALDRAAAVMELDADIDLLRSASVSRQKDGGP